MAALEISEGDIMDKASSVIDTPISSKNVSVFMKSPSRVEALSEDVSIRNVYMLSLDKVSFNESSYRYYRKILSSPSCVRAKVVTNLRDIDSSLYDVLGNALLEIDARKDLIEIILTRGSSVQFNCLFPYLERIYRNHCVSGKPVMIVYSSTTASQKAYEKLYTLRGIDAKAHLKLGDVEGVNPVAIISPSKPMKKALKSEPIDDTCVLDCSESEMGDKGRMSLAISKLKGLHSPIIVHFSPDVKEEFLDCSQQGIALSQGAADSGICKMFYDIIAN